MRDKIKRLLLVMITVLMTFVNAVPMNVMAKDLSNPDRAAIIKEAEKHEDKPYVYLSLIHILKSMVQLS